MDELKQHVHCHLPIESCTMFATGIPASIGILQRVHLQQEAFRELREETREQFQRISSLPRGGIPDEHMPITRAEFNDFKESIERSIASMGSWVTVVTMLRKRESEKSQLEELLREHDT